MGFLSGAMAGAAGDAGGQMVSNAQSSMDLNNAQQLAAFKSNLDTQQATAATMLKDKLDHADKVDALTGEVGNATRQATVLNAQTTLDPTVAKANQQQANLADVQVAPGHDLDQIDPTTGKVNTIGHNNTITVAETKAYNPSTASVNMAKFTAKEADDAMTSVATDAKEILDPVTQKPSPVAGAIAKAEFNAALARGVSLQEARSWAGTMSTQVSLRAQALMNSPAGKGMSFDQAQQVIVDAKNKNRDAAAATVTPGTPPGVPATPPADPSTAAASAPSPYNGPGSSTGTGGGILAAQMPASKPAAAAAPAPAPAPAPAQGPAIGGGVPQVPGIPGIPKPGEGPLARVSALELSNVANSPRSSPEARAAAKAELASRPAPFLR